MFTTYKQKNGQAHITNNILFYNGPDFIENLELRHWMWFNLLPMPLSIAQDSKMHRSMSTKIVFHIFTPCRWHMSSVISKA